MITGTQPRARLFALPTPTFDGQSDAQRWGGPRSWARWAVPAVAAVLLLGSGGYLWSQRTSGPLIYEVAGGMVGEGGYVRGSGPNGARLTFSDGTRVDVAEGARSRVVSVDSRGARITLENGHAALSVVERPSAVWLVDAGPFVIRATGTDLDVDWSSVDQTLSVDVHQGTMDVSGPPVPSGVRLRGGQRFTASEGRLSLETLVETPLVQPTYAAPIDG